MNEFDIIIRPYITEKSTSAVAEGKYTFVVDINATKVDVKKAIEKIFDVKDNTLELMATPSSLQRVC